jgi:hypothetical protein
VYPTEAIFLKFTFTPPRQPFSRRRMLSRKVSVSGFSWVSQAKVLHEFSIKPTDINSTLHK